MGRLNDTKLARVLAVVGEPGGVLDGCNMWRCIQPVEELYRQGYRNAGWDYMDNPLLEYVWRTYDAVILPRRFWEPEDEAAENNWFSLMHGAGKAVIYEIDDDLFSDDLIKRLVDIHGKTLERARTIRDATIRALRKADGVTVSSEYLAVVIGQYTDKPIKVVPNFIDLRWFRGMKAANKRWIPPLTIGWAGGIRPDADVEQMAIAWGRIAERFPEVTFVIQGHQAQIIFDHVPEDRVKSIPWMPIDEYPAGMLNIDIGCCPLANTPFNRSKTYIKAMEYAALGAAVVASPTVYQQVIDDGRDGFIAENADEWETALADLVSSANRRKRMAQALERKVAQHHSLEGNAWRWQAAWAEIVEDFQSRQTRVFLPAGVTYRRPLEA